MVMTYNFATAPLLTNPYNEFLGEGGKVWRGDRATATALDGRVRVGGPPAHRQGQEFCSAEGHVLMAGTAEAWRNSRDASKFLACGECCRTRKSEALQH